MGLDIGNWEKLLPPELTSQKKERLKDGLSQFIKGNEENDKIYTDFYSTLEYNYFLQGDLIREIRFPKFDFETREYEKEYFDVVLLSNTCDMDNLDSRRVRKNIIVAKLVPFELYVESLSELSISNSAQIIKQIKSQLYSNILYLPPTFNNQEFIVLLDEVSWITPEEISLMKEEISENRIASLDFFGYYLFILKLSYHFCRLPEETHR